MCIYFLKYQLLTSHLLPEAIPKFKNQNIFTLPEDDDRHK